MKYEIKKTTISYSKKKAKQSKNVYKDIESKMKKIENTRDWQQNANLIQEHEKLKQNLNALSDHITRGIIMKSKVTWFEQGEKNTKFFLTLEKKRKNKTHVRKILDNDKETVDPSDILKKLKEYYSNIYSKKNKKTEEDCFEFVKNINVPQLSKTEKQSCESLLKNKECFESLKAMGNNNTPGIDGLSKEFYMTFWPELGEMMVCCFNYSFKEGTLSSSQNQVYITLLEKPDKDIRLIENWRPISLINVDSKICSKTLCNRLVNLMPKLIHPNQAGFVKGRTIDEIVRFLLDLFVYS